MTLLSTDRSMAAFNSIPGQGIIYSVVVRDPLLNTSASYVPVHTYACSFMSTLDGCQTLGELFKHLTAHQFKKNNVERAFLCLFITGKISTKVFFTITGLAGLFVCFFGHRFFKCGE